jgi:hypothetical protein
MGLPRIFRREPDSLKGVRERSTIIRSAELALPAFSAPVSREQARAALARSRAGRDQANPASR